MSLHTNTKIFEEGGFSLGDPMLVCRWRLAGGNLLLANRHLRALSNRIIKGKRLPKELLAWAKQHIEWTLADGAALHPNGVLMLLVDEQNKAAMCVGDYEPLARTKTADLQGRAQESYTEARTTGIAPETLWLVHDDSLLLACEPTDKLSGAALFVQQLANTIGFSVIRKPDLLASNLDGYKSSEVFLVSDEHGVVPASDACGARSEKFQGAYQSLFEKSSAGQL